MMNPVGGKGKRPRGRAARPKRRGRRGHAPNAQPGAKYSCESCEFWLLLAPARIWFVFNKNPSGQLSILTTPRSSSDLVCAQQKTFRSHEFGPILVPTQIWFVFNAYYCGSYEFLSHLAPDKIWLVVNKNPKRKLSILGTSTRILKEL